MLRAFQIFLDELNIPSSFIDEQRTLITFTIDDVHYLYSYHSELDPSYIRIMIPNVGQINIDDSNTLRMLNNLTTRFKTGKAIEQNGQLWLVAESFVYDRNQLNLLFQRMISVLKDMLDSYRGINNGQ